MEMSERRKKKIEKRERRRLTAEKALVLLAWAFMLWISHSDDSVARADMAWILSQVFLVLGFLGI